MRKQITEPFSGVTVERNMAIDIGGVVKDKIDPEIVCNLRIDFAYRNND